MKNKKGVDLGNWLVPLILAIIILVILLFFLFRESFEDNADLEVCRQSIILRANTPELSAGGVVFSSFKDKFPLKCKTDVINIDFNDTKKVEKIFSDSLAQCWYLFLEGKKPIFPRTNIEYESYCVPCARIHFDKSVRGYYEEKTFFKGENIGDTRIDVDRALANTLDKTSMTYRQYLGDAFRIADPFSGQIEPYFIRDNFFNIWSSDDEPFYKPGENIASISLPRYLSNSYGDIMVFHGQLISNDQDKFGNSPGYLFYFQTNQRDKNGNLKNPFSEASQKVAAVTSLWITFRSATLCDQYDGIFV